MSILEEQLFRTALRYEIVKDLPGYLRIRFPAYHHLPREALPYVHYINDAMTLFPGIHTSTTNPTIGTLLIRYEPASVSTRTVRLWIQILIDETINLFKEYSPDFPEESVMVQMIRARLLDRMVQVL